MKQEGTFEQAAANELPTNLSTTSRKQDHIDICLSKNVESDVPSEWDKIIIPHCALPELNFSKITTELNLWGQTLGSPIFISSMTGGNLEGDKLNLKLAKLANRHRLAMGVGSQRIFLENKSSNSFKLRKLAPNAVLFANIGAVQLNYGVSVDDCRLLVDSLEAQALILHTNVLQESIQQEGDRNFSDLWSKISELKKNLQVPLILKETGCGLDAMSCKRAVECGIDALDSSGMGGTHWGFIEGLRSNARRELGNMFKNWGIPSLQALQNCVQNKGPETVILASGGLRSGLDIAKAIYCGAKMGGMALPFLRAASKSEESLENYFQTQNEALKIAMFCAGANNLETLGKLNNNDR